MSYQEVDTFNLIVGGDIREELEGRATAVARAKELSGEGLRVSLERTDNMVTMQFADGSLETYVCETRDRKPRRRDRQEDRPAEEMDGEISDAPLTEQQESAEQESAEQESAEQDAEPVETAEEL